MTELIKLVFVGNIGVGKTTAIRAISDRDPVSTEMPISDGALGTKTHTTVALDYGTTDIGDNELLHVYGVPGQRYLDFMWPLVCEGAIGVVVLVAANDDNAVGRAHELLTEFGRIAAGASFAVGVTKADLSDDFALLEFRDDLIRLGHRLPIVRVDTRVTDQVETLIRILLSYRYAESKLASAG
ncbi:GTP-binding protein [Pseudomonas sp. CGJS7]|uniref:GTP-binding protein n=1 Tax=Pseudomonas sp. CGJS7 TaxID=3109348 RepID=UPI0030085D39